MLRYQKSGQGTRIDTRWVIEDRDLGRMDKMEEEFCEGAVEMEVTQPSKQLLVKPVVILEHFEEILAIHLLVFCVGPAVTRLEIGL
jgi:hypothetical protein